MKNKNNIKVTVTYLGHFSSDSSQEYRVEKIQGAPTVEVEQLTNKTKFQTVRVGDIIDEAQATELATRVDLTVVKK